MGTVGASPTSGDGTFNATGYVPRETLDFLKEQQMSASTEQRWQTRAIGDQSSATADI
jgi:hypothetical protein